MLGFKTKCAYKNLHPCENWDKKTLSSFWNQWGQPLHYVICTRKDNCARDKLSPAIGRPKIRLTKEILKTKLQSQKCRKHILFFPFLKFVAMQKEVKMQFNLIMQFNSLFLHRI